MRLRAWSNMQGKAMVCEVGACVSEADMASLGGRTSPNTSASNTASPAHTTSASHLGQGQLCLQVSHLLLQLRGVHLQRKQLGLQLGHLLLQFARSGLRSVAGWAGSEANEGGSRGHSDEGYWSPGQLAEILAQPCRYMSITARSPESSHPGLQVILTWDAVNFSAPSAS